EIVNADSQQVYRYMDIGTGKPSLAERERVRHHLIDVVNPDQEFNAAMFRHLASEAVYQIDARKRSAIVCGGTGLYLKALIRGLFEGPAQDSEFRRSLAKEIEETGLPAVYRRLVEIDPTVVSAIHPNDRLRTIRALEVYHLTGKPISQWQKEHRFQERPFETLKIGLNRERPELYERINRRSAAMVEAGFLDEVRGLAARGYSLDLKPLRSVGYAQMAKVVRGMLTLDAALEEMTQETRHLAKRQLTWFRGDKEVRWFHPKQAAEIIIEVKAFFSTR
ncbi:MAG TPA: tRNA (adenosine(37)-N6)-dimethylallyltransferase MiaA, partial [Candidatus Binatia bacterium]|nr:tRNA (adenosine(37)-N6)-dimethylallyltransferase MiaA [Candidatus Binatia bacterium]